MILLPDYLLILPILVPLSGAAVALLLRRYRPVQEYWVLGTMITSLSLSFWLLFTVWETGVPSTYQFGGWAAPFGITLVADLLAALFVMMVQLVMMLGLIYAVGSRDNVVTYPFFYPFFLTLATGLTGTMLTGDLFNLFVFAELLVISGTVMTAMADDRFGVEAAFKYFYMSLLASFFLLLAVGCMYVSYGTLNLADLSQEISGTSGIRPLLWPGIALLLATFMIKSAVFPFHFWQPDFHTAAPTAVSAMLSSVVVKLGIYGFLRMSTLLFVEQAAIFRPLLLLLGVVGIIYGGLSALATDNVKRMLAYSTLAQVGFILVGIGWGTTFAIAAAIVFAFNHSLIKAAMLMIAGYVASRAAVKSAAFEVVTGVGKTLPVAGVLFFIGGMALAGIPPTNGFVSKALLFDSGLTGEEYGVLLVIGVASIFTLLYVMRAFQRIWWLAPQEGTKIKPTGDRLLAPLLLVLLILILGIWAGPLVDVALKASQWLSSPEIYIQAVLNGG